MEVRGLNTNDGLFGEGWSPGAEEAAVVRVRWGLQEGSLEGTRERGRNCRRNRGLELWTMGGTAGVRKETAG